MNPVALYHQSLRLQQPSDISSGLDQQIQALIGRFKRRSAILTRLYRQGADIHQRSLALHALSEQQLTDKLTSFRDSIRRGGRNSDNAAQQALAHIGEIAYRTLGQRPYPEQLAGTLALQQGCLVEMATGEGKSLTAALAAILQGWTTHPCHIVTTNEYLARRDSENFAALFSRCGCTAAWVGQEMTDETRRRAYRAAVTYTTGRELMADFLRDRLKLQGVHDAQRWVIRHLLQPRQRPDQQLVQRGLDLVIVDEADSVLIDGAVVPLILAQPDEDQRLPEACRIAQDIADVLEKGVDYRTEQARQEIQLTTSGRQKIAAHSVTLSPFWQAVGRREELLLQALRVKEWYRPGKQYVVQDGKVVIVDEFTGRMLIDNRWQHGLHQAVEAAEGLAPTNTDTTVAAISVQQFFRLVPKLAAMTATAMEEAHELWQIYNLPAVTIPSHKPCRRLYFPDRLFSSQAKKWAALLQSITEQHSTGRPVLIGTRSVAASEHLSALLTRAGLSHTLLNALRHQEEAAIVARAGEKGNITIATNMAGRGTDIKLGPGVADLGGLHVIASERHESRRIDRQLFGRAARQGDPGSAQAFACLEDELLQRHLSGTTRNALALALTTNLPGSACLAAHCITSAQNRAQRQARQQRRHIMERDNWIRETLAFTGPATTA